MDIGLNDCIIAIVTMDKDMKSSTVPVFYAQDREDLERRSLIISKCVMGMVHDALNDTFIIVKH
ncbi:capping complex subunit for YIEGIA [Tepidibacter aestuarii]|uniref:capping complex subunit for YIEGIA n=1 Tax=Tepidibacter aestuarii TaxID=2925782 RepID=UPI0020C07338|nr:hypothetical protein [Tepidibacter aestuarii]CAH2212765.1 conserved protein of unknown function [Tepidibacter aestuarii]